MAGPPVTARRPRWRLALLGAAAVLAPGVQMVEWLRGHPIEVPVVAAGSIFMLLLIVARTHGLTREVSVQDERRRLLGRVLQATEDERTRIAHDLHDGPVQQLAVLNYDVYRAQRFEQEHGIAVEIGLGLGGRLPAELETVLYRIMHESLSKVAKHARATRVLVTVDQADPETARLRVRDDGVGFDASDRAQLLREGHFGLAGMRERASPATAPRSRCGCRWRCRSLT